MSMPINQFLNIDPRPELGNLSYPLPQSIDTSTGWDGNSNIRIANYGGTKVTTHRDQGAAFDERGFYPASEVKINTGNSDDIVHIKKIDGRITAIANGVAIKLDIDESNRSGNQAKLFIKTHGGDDTVIIDPDVKTEVTIDTGEGNDQVMTGGGHAQVHLGNGDDLGVLGQGGGELSGEAGDDKLYGGTAGAAHLSGGSGSNIMMSGIQRTDDQSTWILAQGEHDKIMVRSLTTIRIESQSAYTVVLPDAQAQIQITETAGNTETVSLESGSDDNDMNVTFTGRNEVGKDTQRTQQAPRNEQEKMICGPTSS
ncbi:hypothetical protein [Pseudomonas sp. SDO5271_S396]